MPIPRILMTSTTTTTNYSSSSSNIVPTDTLNINTDNTQDVMKLGWHPHDNCHNNDHHPLLLILLRPFYNHVGYGALVVVVGSVVTWAWVNFVTARPSSSSYSILGLLGSVPNLTAASKTVSTIDYFALALRMFSASSKAYKSKASNSNSDIPRSGGIVIGSNDNDSG